MGTNGAGKFLGPLVKGSGNWFQPMCLYPKCSNLNGQFKSFISPHHLGLGSCRHMDFSPLWGPREGRGSVANIDLSPLGGPQEGMGDVVILSHYGDHGVGKERKGGKIPWG